MEWDQKLQKECFKHKIELAIHDKHKQIQFTGSVMPEEELKIKLVQIIPKEFEYTFHADLKIATKAALKIMLENIEFSGHVDIGERRIVISSPSMSIKPDAAIWEQIPALLEYDGYVTEYKITIGNKTVSNQTESITQLARRILRETRISADEIKDLHISLGIDRDVNDFIKEMFPE